VLRDEFFDFIPISLFEVEAGAQCWCGEWEEVVDYCLWGGGQIPDLEGYAIRVWELNETKPVRHLERSGRAAFECRGR